MNVYISPTDNMLMIVHNYVEVLNTNTSTFQHYKRLPLNLWQIGVGFCFGCWVEASVRCVGTVLFPSMHCQWRSP